MSRVISKSRINRDKSVGNQDRTVAASGGVDALTVERLVFGQDAEAIDFLSANTIDNAIMIGLIRDNGLDNAVNRGQFYGCRNASGELVGVALIGHITLFDARDAGAIAAFAGVARNASSLYATTGEQLFVEQFWRNYAKGRDLPHNRTRELLLELRLPCLVMNGPNDLRLATADDLDMVVDAHALLTQEEIGVNPLATDPVGFRQRCLRRTQQHRVWVWIDEGRLKFKAEVISEIPDVVYLEGVFVGSRERGKGVGSNCLSFLSHILLSRMPPGGTVSVLVNQQNYRAHAFYAKIGFRIRSSYLRITLQR